MEDDGKFPGPDEIIEHGKGMSRGGRKRRRKGGKATGELARHRLDHRPRRVAGGSLDSQRSGGSFSDEVDRDADEHPGVSPDTSTPTGVKANAYQGTHNGPDDWKKAGGRMHRADGGGDDDLGPTAGPLEQEDRGQMPDEGKSFSAQRISTSYKNGEPMRYGPLKTINDIEQNRPAEGVQRAGDYDVPPSAPVRGLMTGRTVSEPFDPTADRRSGQAHGGRTTPSGGVKASYRHAAEKHGHTMAGGSFPIEDAHDLSNAKHDVGRAKNPAAARAWINKRAKELGEPGLGE